MSTTFCGARMPLKTYLVGLRSKDVLKFESVGRKKP